MRKHSPRKWLHAVLDLLPVILIPVFMIYSHRHDLSTDITYTQDVYKDFYQNIKNGKPISLEYWSSDSDNLNFDTYDGSLADYSGDDIYVNNVHDITFNTEDTLYYSFDLSVALSFQLQPYIEVNLFSDGDDAYIFSDTLVYTFVDNVYNHISGLFSPFEDGVYDAHFQFYIETYSEFYLKNIQLFNLTMIFGSGNEPTKEVFESYLTQDYYDFGSNEVKIGTTQVTAKNNDIMSVFTDSFNNTISKYFDMGNVFGLRNVYQWFNTNLFGGSAPQVVYSVYVIIVYEFVMDLIFLLYSVFMFIIDFAERLMDSFFDKSFGGGR